MHAILEFLSRLVGPVVERSRQFIFRPVLAQLEQHRRESLELERLLLTIARVEHLGEARDPSRPDVPKS